jgi:hypothetical protein
MKVVFNYLFFITLIFFSASFCNLKSEEPEGLDFLDNLLKELEKIEPDSRGTNGSHAGAGTSTGTDAGSSYSQPYSSYSSSDYASTPATKPEPEEKAVVKKDIQELFLNPDTEKIPTQDKKTKIRPTKRSSEALKHYTDEFEKASGSVKNKLEINQDLPPIFKETSLREFDKEAETTNSLLEIIGAKGIYKTAFLEPAKQKIEKESSKTETAPRPTSPVELRKSFLAILKDIQNLDSEIALPHEEAEPNQEILQKIAQKKTPRGLPKYQPLAPKTKPITPIEMPVATEELETQDALEK